MHRKLLRAGLGALLTLGVVVPTAMSSASAEAPASVPLPHSDIGTPPPTVAGQLPIQAADIAVQHLDQPGTGVVLNDTAARKRAAAAAGSPQAWAKAQAQAQAMLKDYNARKAAGTLPLPHGDSAPSGHRPYGGDLWSGGTAAATRSTCSVGLPSRSTSGAQYEYTAGHCVREDGVHDDISGTNGVFCQGWVSSCPSIDIGNTGHGGTCVGSAPTCGDRTFLRGSKIPVGQDGRAEVRTWDSRVTVAVPAVRNPVQGESASMSGGFGAHLLRGVVFTEAQPTTFAAPLPVIYDAVMRSTTPCGASCCPVPGDSGGSVIGSNHDVIGTLTGHGISSDNYCFIFFGRAGDAFVVTNQVPAPQP